MLSPPATAGRLRREFRTITLKDLTREVVHAYDANDLLTFASAIAFRVLFAFIPFALFAFGLLGLFGLTGVWRHDVAPDLAHAVSPQAYSLINSTVLRVLGGQNLFWVTVGLAIAVWELSAGTRAVMDVLDRVYCCERERTVKERYVVSLTIAVVAGLLLLSATALFMLGPLLSGVLTFVRWPVCAVLLLAAVAVFVRHAPADQPPLAWVSVGSLLIVLTWLAMSVGFAFYIRNLADYGSVYGALAVVMVTFEYVYLTSLAFLTGAQVDQLIRERAQSGS